MIKVNGLEKSYGSHRAINDINFHLPKNQVLGLLGLNGAGKSTTMNIIAGCLSSSGGSVLIDGVDIELNPREAKGKIGYLPEVPPLYLEMKVSEYLGFIYELKGVKVPKKAHLAAVAEMVGAHKVYHRLIGNLSKGYRQRVGLGGALIGDPPILILDEPTVGLDPSQMSEIRALIKHLGATHTVIYSSHILSEIQAVCQRVIVIHEGRIIADDTPKQLSASMYEGAPYTLTAEGNTEKLEGILLGINGLEGVELIEKSETIAQYRLLGVTDVNIRRETSHAVTANGYTILEFSPQELGLEEVFLRLVGRAGGTGQ